MKKNDGELVIQKSLAQRAQKAFLRDYQLILLCVPALLFVLVFNYGPMYGLQIAFKNYSARKGIIGSPWCGFKHFARFFTSPYFWDILWNTLRISIYSLIAGFPFPILLALMVNQVKNLKFKKTVQMVLYAPHFISVVVLCGMLYVFLSPSTGIVNTIIASFGFEKVFFLAKANLFDDIFVWSDIWQNTGWDMIIYLAALSAIPTEQYEAAKIDGANKFQLIRHIEIPSIIPTIVILFIMRVGKLMNIGFQKAFLLQNSLNAEKSEIIATYVYKVGLLDSQFSYSTAIGLFNTLINIILIVSVNQICKRLNETSLW